MNDFLFRGCLKDVDSAVNELIQIEAERQVRKLILIPSESTAPQAVREAMGSVFQNIYAEGYPDENTRWMTEKEILTYEERLGEFRRYGDPRYYKGVEYADVVEALARRRCAMAFAANGVHPEDIYVNVQALSGAPANNAVYHALISPGDVLMGMNLFHGGHLTHGSPANRSGRLYQAVHYSVDPETERINYDAVQDLALQHKPKIIVVGYSSYPWTVDWLRFRSIADSVNAYLMADIAHVAGMVVAGAYPTPVGYADVITFTTHKTLCGPRGACILTTNPTLARKIDKAVFPGEQGGPHVHIFAALAITFKLAVTPQFHDLQHQIVKNTAVFTERLRERGFRIAFGGSDTHLMNLDVKSVCGKDGTPLNGEMAARILDLAGIVVNRNTIPGDTSALNPSGLRMASPWITQRGFKENEMVSLADIIADVLQAIEPYHTTSKGKKATRAKVDFWTLEEAKIRVRSLAAAAGMDYSPQPFGYPHFYYVDDNLDQVSDWVTLTLSGEHSHQYLNYILSSDIGCLKAGESQPTQIALPKKEKGKYRFVDGVIRRTDEGRYELLLPKQDGSLAAVWLRDLADGYIDFDIETVRKLPGAVVVQNTKANLASHPKGNPIDIYKPYFIGREQYGSIEEAAPLPLFQWKEVEEAPNRRTSVYDVHLRLGAKMIPFAGWEMPVWYSTVVDEHLAVRQHAGLFDVSHMGVYQAEGKDACAFLDCVCANDISSLAAGESLYTHFMDADSHIIDDLMVYRRAEEKYLVVVNAANDDKDWAWLNAVKKGIVKVDNDILWAKAYGRNVHLRNLRDAQAGDDMRVDIALQGPKSRDILLALECDVETKRRILRLKRTDLCEAVVGGFDMVISRTGYTGEKMAFELFIHPEKAAALFEALLDVGTRFNLKPCGLAARDSLRTEAGLPLYGHELVGPLSLGAGEAGFSSYVKTYKPWFIGRSAYIKREQKRSAVVVRFKFMEKGVRLAHLGNPVVDERGKVIGFVSSCAVDRDGMLCGQAYIDAKYAQEDSPIFIFQVDSKESLKSPQALLLGDKTIIPTPAKVISRFMK